MSDPMARGRAYDPAAVEAKWQARWAERRTNEPDLDGAARPFYNLMMFPYPSAEGLHVGNFYAFTGSDVFGRFRRLQGHDVFEPMGFDAFGIHSENFALKVGTHPGELIPRNIANFRRQLERLGGMFDWRHELSTTDPAYYKWTQWLFLQLFRAGKAYRRQAPVNWCPSCKTVVANEQVEAGRCERCGTAVEQRLLEQWFFRITEYAPRLLANLDDRSKMDWSATTTTAQRNWIGRSEGAEIVFRSDKGHEIPVFTTRADTLFGATFLVLAPEHPLVGALTSAAQREAVAEYLAQAARKDLVSRKVGDREKTGVFTGGFARNPATGRMVPVWVADYVLMEYGTGAIMAVPAHDERDLEFARRFALPIVTVLDDDGRLVDSGEFTGLPAAEGRAAITRWLESAGHGRATVSFRLHDWCISRQRYWGPPIPIIHCDACGPVAVPEADLPVLLPEIQDFRPDDSGVSPLARHAEWYYAPCPACGRQGRRETDVSDTFLDSAWYYLRYPSTEFADRPFDPARTRRWLPVARYIGGNEHAVLHLLYARYIAMVLHDLGHLEFEEPFRVFRAHGLIIKDGAKMSKSRGNVVIPDEFIGRFGADSFRLFLMFLGPFEDGGDFRDEGISGPRRFLDKVWALVQEAARAEEPSEIRHDLMARLHRTIRKVTEDIEALHYNTAIAALMELTNALREANCCGRLAIEPLVVMLAPFAPHFAEECWEQLGHEGTVFAARWPAWEAALLVEDEAEVVVQVNGRTRGKVTVAREADEETVVRAALAEPAVRRFTEGVEVRKRIYVRGRLLNLVVG